MRIIGSTRTATRCWSSSVRLARRTSHRATLIAVLAFSAAGCTRTSTYYIPTPGEAGLNQDEFRDESDRMLTLECPRLMGTGSYATGEARARVQIDRSGAVQRLEFTRPTHDDHINTIWGALAARLQFDPQEGQTDELRTSLFTIGYSCGKGVALTTLQL